LSIPIEQIEIMIGEALLADDFGSKPAGDAEKRAVARRRFETNLTAFQRSVCGSALVRETGSSKLTGVVFLDDHRL
jgi:hypothetical protein